jgi:DNA-binding NtrC family response regulator
VPEDKPPLSREGATRSLRKPAAAAALPLAVILRPIGCEAHPRTFRLAAGAMTIGAGSKADLIVESSTVSRAHAELALVEDGVRVRDLGSRNGTFFLGQRIDSLTVAPGSRIRLGDVELAIDPDWSDTSESAEGTNTSYLGLIGHSPPMRRLFTLLRRLEGSLVNVLVLGESGSGKELVARAIHGGSLLAEKPLVAKNCGAMSRELVMSELFGHRRGAFTGAHESRKGAFELAHGGTLFLDEIGELPLDVQPMLLRALESGEVTPLGSNDATHVKVRMIAATHRNLEEAVRAGTFREDLYYRIAVVKLSIPALRERAGDIELLAQHFARSLGIGALPDDLLARWRSLPFPGNARELRNAVEAYAALGDLPEAPTSTAAEVGAGLRPLIDLERPFMDQKDALTDRFTREYLTLLMDHTGGNQSEAARVSGLERSYLRKLLAKHGVSK